MRAASWRDRQATGLVHVERQCSAVRWSNPLIFSKSTSLMPPRRIWFDGMPVCSAMMRAASCSADISSEKKPTMPPLTVLVWPSGLTCPRHALAML